MTTAEPPLSVEGATVRAIREGVGLSGRKLAEKVGVSHQHLARVETGQRPLTPDLSQRIARAIADQLAS